MAHGTEEGTWPAELPVVQVRLFTTRRSGAAHTEQSWKEERRWTGSTVGSP